MRRTAGAEVDSGRVWSESPSLEPEGSQVGDYRQKCDMQEAGGGRTSAEQVQGREVFFSVDKRRAV